jgi:hypothetical protein
MKNNKKKPKVKLKEFIEEEFKNSLPITILPDNSVVYKKYRIKQNKRGDFSLHYAGLDNKAIDRFNLKVCALVAAKRHDQCRLDAYNTIKDLDRKYWNNYADAKYFQHIIKTTKDTEKQDILTSRLQESTELAKLYKQEITALFRMSF